MASDLQSLGQENVRQIILARYKALGIQDPRCLTICGGFSRERANGKTTLARNGGNDRSKPLSDSVFNRDGPQQTVYSLCEDWDGQRYTRDPPFQDKFEPASKSKLLLKEQSPNIGNHPTTTADSDEDDRSSIRTAISLRHQTLQTGPI